MKREADYRRCFSQWMRRRRNSLGLTVVDIAEIINMDDKHLGRLDRGEKTPGGPTVALIKYALEMDLSDFEEAFIQTQSLKDTKQRKR